MEKYSVDKIGSIGYISKEDVRPYELPDNSLSDVFNVRTINGAVEHARGWITRDIFDPAGGGLHALAWNETDADLWILAFGNTGIYSLDEVGQNDVTRASGPYAAGYPDNIWITDNFNGYIIATNGVDAPQIQYASPVTNTTLFADMTGWPASTTAVLTIAYKNYIVMFNINELTGRFDNMVWWSDESQDGLPPTSWDYTNPDNRSGRTVLGTDSGAIVAVKKLRDSVFIYCQNGVFRMDWVGGNEIFKFTEVFKNVGAFGPRCVEEADGKHLVVTNNDIVVHDGHQLNSVSQGRVGRRFFETIDPSQSNMVYITYHTEPDAKEMWVCIPSAADRMAADLVYAIDMKSGAWSLRALPCNRHMLVMPTLYAVNTYRTLCQEDPDTTNCLVEDTPGGDAGYTVDNYAVATYSYNSFASGTRDWVLYGVGKNDTFDRLFRMDIGFEYPECPLMGGYLDTVLEKEDINVTNDETVQMIHAIYPRAKGDNPIDVYVGGSSSNEGTIRWKGPFTFTPNVDYRITPKVRGRRFAIRFKPAGPNPFRIEGYDIVYAQAGMR